MLAHGKLRLQERVKADAPADAEQALKTRLHAEPFAESLLEPSRANPSGNGSPGAHTAPSTKVSRFQMGTDFLTVSMSQRQASKAAERCAEATTIRMLVSPISRRPRR